MTSPINSTSSLTGTSTDNTASAASSATTQALGQDAFLKLLMAQMQNQDPLQPTDGTQFVTQLAQFSQVEQAVAQSTTLGNISTQLQGLSNSNASDLVGKTVTVSTGTLQWGNGSISTVVNAQLTAPASSVTAKITDSSGNVIATKSLGASQGGPISFNWDGTEDSGGAAPAGSYSVTFSATGPNGQVVPVSQTATGVVSQVTFDQGYAALQLGSGVVAPASQIVSVGAPPAPQTP